VALRDWLFGLFGRRAQEQDMPRRTRGPAIHVIILDGTLSSLEPGQETNAGLTFKLLREGGRHANLTLYYEAGIQWRDWKSTPDVMMGRGINRQIERAYGVLASRYRPGDRIILIGYSRGAYAVRSLAGVIDLVGLVRHEEATVRNIQLAYRHYRAGGKGEAAHDFKALYCHGSVTIEAVAVWDTVKALGLRLPILWRWAEAQHAFHNHALGRGVMHGFHALALDETREAYAPILWTCPPNWPGVMEQVWFKGTHGDVGGQVGDYPAARPLANIPLVWMLERLSGCGLMFPAGWRERFICDVTAPSIGTWGGWGKLFLSRRRRIVGRDRSERLHESVRDRVIRGAPRPKAVPATRVGASGGDI
jgi:uncharacterized protein (DUF2235 family)